MGIEGWYYLHENGSLIYKRELDGTIADLRESTFVRAIWPHDSQEREYAWNLVIEAEVAGANQARIDELATLWGCDEDDAMQYGRYIGVDFRKDGNAWSATVKDAFINIQESACGFGETRRQALVALAKSLGVKPGKMWQTSFPELVKRYRQKR
jgi:hypothetical protein